MSFLLLTFSFLCASILNVGSDMGQTDRQRDTDKTDRQTDRQRDTDRQTDSSHQCLVPPPYEDGG